jgi:hypothetical protein
MSSGGSQYTQQAAAWACQMCASVAWVICVLIYDSWQKGDVIQMVAASAWTASNLLSLPHKQQQQQQQQQQQGEEKGGSTAAAVPAERVAAALAADEDGPGQEESGTKAENCASSNGEGADPCFQLAAAWALQMCASVAWVISVLIYDSWQKGDVFQMLAASAWTASNLLSLPYAAGKIDI